jgi:hypothetical protein
VPTVNAADVVIITGGDLSGILQQPGPPGPAVSSPATTAAPTTTTTLPSSIGGVAPQGDPAEQACA